MRYATIALAATLCTASVASAETTIGSYIDAENNDAGRAAMAIYIRGLVDAWAHANLQLQAVKALRQFPVKPLFCDPNLYADIDEIHAYLEQWVRGMKHSSSKDDFDKFLQTTGLANAILAHLEQQYPCP